jgi:Fibronectin type III domain
VIGDGAIAKIFITTAILATSAAGAYVAITSGSAPSIVPASVTDTYANGSATVNWSAPAGTTVTGYRVTIYPTYTDRVPRPNLGPNGGMVQVTVSASTHSYTFPNLLVDCHQRYNVSVETKTPSGLSQPVYTQSFRPSGNVAAGQDPPYVVVVVDGIRSDSPGFTLKNAYAPTTPGTPQSYCPESWSPGAPGNSAGTESEADILKAPNGPWSFLHKWNVGEINYSSGTPDTSNFNSQWESEPKALASNGSTSSFTHSFMLDDLAAQGAVILPFSYHTDDCDASTGAKLTGTMSDPVFSFPDYNSGDSFGTDCGVAHIGALGGGFGFGPGVNYWGDALVHEVTSIHTMWPSSKIVVVGHSQGGLVVTDAWLQGFNVPHVRAFSLDSPINGSCGAPGCIGPPGYPPYESRTVYDEGSDGYLGIDQSQGNNMHFIGTYGDSPIITLPGPPRCSLNEFDVEVCTKTTIHIHSYDTGSQTLEHQLPFDYSQHDPGYVDSNCNVEAGKNGGWPQVHSTCPAPNPPDYLSPCPVDFNTVAPWITDTGHFVVKYCPGIISHINQIVEVSDTPGPVKPDELAVMGDSYSSGEGSGDWISPTGDGDFASKTGDTCHRSSHAYAVTVLNADVFEACSGSTSGDIENGARGDGSQLAHLGPGIKTVVLSAGGDDAGFSSVLSECTSSLDLPAGQSVALPGHSNSNCGPAITAAENGGSFGSHPYDGFAKIETNLIGLYDAILGPHQNLASSSKDATSPNYAANAHLFVAGYPYIFPPHGFSGCNGITQDNQMLLNNATAKLNNMLRGAVSKVNSQTGPGQVSTNGPRVTFVDISSVTQNHWICGNHFGSSPYINDLQFRVANGDALAASLAIPFAGAFAALLATHNCDSSEVAQWQQKNNLGICSKSFHPNQEGTKAIGKKIKLCIYNVATCDPGGTPQPKPQPSTSTRDTSACQVNTGQPSSPGGTLPSAGPFQTALTTAALEKVLGSNQPLTTRFGLNTTAWQRQGTGLDQSPAPSAVSMCTWNGSGVRVTLSVVPYATPELAREAFTTAPMANAGAQPLTGVGDAARLYPTISGDSSSASVLSGRFFFSVTVGNVMMSANSVPVAKEIVRELNTSGNARPAPSPSPLVTPGYGSPEDAVDGFYQGELAGDWAAACSYVTPSAQALCLSGTSGQGAATGKLTFGRGVISGGEALVPVTGSICAPGSPCVANSDPGLGMPTPLSQFPAAYQAAVNNSLSGSVVVSAMPCSQVGGKWYVTLG